MVSRALPAWKVAVDRLSTLLFKASNARGCVAT
jgi:hypothetical protein